MWAGRRQHESPVIPGGQTDKIREDWVHKERARWYRALWSVLRELVFGLELQPAWWSYVGDNPGLLTSPPKVFLLKIKTWRHGRPKSVHEAGPTERGKSVPESQETHVLSRFDETTENKCEAILNGVCISSKYSIAKKKIGLSKIKVRIRGIWFLLPTLNLKTILPKTLSMVKWLEPKK